MNKVNLYSNKGTKLEVVSLPKEFGEKVNLKLLAQAIRVFETKSHVGLAKTKTRAEVNRTKRKWYKQKGTGGARHGARSAPIFVGGGVAHGPKPVKKRLSLPKKMAKKALLTAFSAKRQEGEICLVKDLGKLAKTSQACLLGQKVRQIMDKPKAKISFVLAKKDYPVLARVFRNLENSQVLPWEDLNAYQVFFAGILAIDKATLIKAKKKEK